MNTFTQIRFERQNLPGLKKKKISLKVNILISKECKQKFMIPRPPPVVVDEYKNLPPYTGFELKRLEFT